jgi:hypothetical protein
MPKYVILPNVEDIELFLSAGVDKSKNDENNKIRERIISCMFEVEVDEEYIIDPMYGDNWRDIKDKFIATVSTLCDKPFEKMVIKHMGGMTNNHDFTLSFIDKNKQIIQTEKIEFKHNNANVVDLVQFLELYDKDCKNKFEVCDVSYAEYYYDNYIYQYLQTDDELGIIPKPEKDEYLKNVYDIKYKHPFFKLLHERKKTNTKEKKDVANESVKTYITKYNTTFNFEKITQKIIDSQKDKVFLLWDCKNFHIQKLNVEDLQIKKITKISDLYFNVEVENFEYDIQVRLNWGNSNGLCNPRWKFSFIHK